MTIHSLDVLLFLFGTSLLFHVLLKLGGFPGGSVVKNLPANVRDARDKGDVSSIPELRRSPGGRNGNPLQYACLENPMDRGACGLQSIGSQRVRHNWACTYTHTHTHTHTHTQSRFKKKEG